MKLNLLTKLFMATVFVSQVSAVTPETDPEVKLSMDLAKEEFQQAMRDACYAVGYIDGKGINSYGSGGEELRNKLFSDARKVNRALNDAERFCGMVTKEDVKSKSPHMKRCDESLQLFETTMIYLKRSINETTRTSKPTEDLPIR